VPEDKVLQTHGKHDHSCPQSAITAVKVCEEVFIFQGTGAGGCLTTLLTLGSLRGLGRLGAGLGGRDLLALGGSLRGGGSLLLGLVLLLLPFLDLPVRME
jgi:hypothetical protein